MLGVPEGSQLLELWVRRQHKVHTGGWTTHSNKLPTSLVKCNGDVGMMSNIVECLVPMKKEVQILDRMAFTLSSWDFEDAKQLFESHPGEAVESLLSTSAVGMGEDAHGR